MDDRRIAACFNGRFGVSHQTVVVGGAPEPLYSPGSRAVIRYRKDYARSALHEIAHWCLATPEQRRRFDYGLPYDPPPRCPGRQALFFAAELDVQALELVFSRRIGVDFQVSADDVTADSAQVAPFARAVHERARRLLLTAQAQAFLAALAC